MQTRKFRIVAALAAGLLATAPCARSQSVFGVVEMDSWGAFSSNLAAFCQSAGLPFALIGLNAMTGPMLKAPNLAGVDVGKQVRVYLLIKTKNEKLQPAVVIALPVAGTGTAYLDTLRDAFTTASEIGSAHVFSGPKGPVPARRLAVVVANGVALVGSDAADADAVAAALRANSVPAFTKLPADIRVGIDVQAVLPMMEQASGKLRGRLGQGPMAAPPGAPDPAVILGAEMDGALALFRQVKRVSLGIKADASAATILTALEVKPGTTLAAMLQRLRPPSERYTGLLPPDALFGVVGGGLAIMDPLAKPYGELIVKMYQGMPGLAGIGPAMRDLMMKMVGLYAGDYAVGLLKDARGKGVLFVEIAAVTDAAKARQIFRDGLAMASDVYKQMPMGLSITSLPDRVHAGVPVSTLRYAFAPPTNAAPGMALPLEMLGPIFEKLAMEYAFVDKDLVFTAGRAGAIDQVIDRLRQPGNPEFYRKSRALFGDGTTPPVEVGHLDITAALPAILPLVPGVKAEQLTTLPPPGAGLGTIEYCRNGAWIGELRVPVSEIRALMATMPMLQSLVPAMGGGGEGEEEAPAPAAQPAPAQRTPGPRTGPRPLPRPLPAPAPEPAP